MKKVLVIAYHYPPLGGGGVFRTLKFTKYLPRFGFKPYVLTVKNAMYQAKDPTLLEDIPPEVRIIRTFSLERKLFLLPFYALRTTPKWIFIPDINIGWLPFAVRRGEQIIKKEGIDVIYATAPIYTSLLIACLLKRRTGKPLVIDFRDPWTQNVFIKYPTKLHKKIEEKMEKFVLKTADHIIANTEPMRLKLIEKYPFIKEKCTTITNGFDAQDFQRLKRKVYRDKFTITYVGYLYSATDPEYFLPALKKLLEEKKEIRNLIRVLFVGDAIPKVSMQIKKFNLTDVVKLVGFVPHKTGLEYMINSDVLLLTIAPEAHLPIAGKTYEYLAAKRPILAIVPDGPSVDLIRSTRSGVVVHPKNITYIKHTLFKLFQEWKKGSLGAIKSDIAVYERKALTEKLAQVFQCVITRKDEY